MIELTLTGILTLFCILFYESYTANCESIRWRERATRYDAEANELYTLCRDLYDENQLLNAVCWTTPHAGP